MNTIFENKELELLANDALEHNAKVFVLDIDNYLGHIFIEYNNRLMMIDAYYGGLLYFRATHSNEGIVLNESCGGLSAPYSYNVWQDLIKKCPKITFKEYRDTDKLKILKYKEYQKI